MGFFDFLRARKDASFSAGRKGPSLLGGRTKGLGSTLFALASPLTGASQGIAQRKAAAEAKKLADRAREDAFLAAEELRGTLGQSLEDQREGRRRAQVGLDRADAIFREGQGEIRDIFSQERQVGSDALSRLNEIILGGDISQLEIDPGFEFRRSEGEKSLERAASKAGTFGSGGNLKDFARFSQDLASQEFGNAINRLFGLQDIGSRANANFANLNQDLIRGRAGLQQNAATFDFNLGRGLSQTRQGNAANVVNALNQTSAANNLQLASIQAQQQGSTNFANTTDRNSLIALQAIATAKGGPVAGAAVGGIGANAGIGGGAAPVGGVPSPSGLLRASGTV